VATNARRVDCIGDFITFLTRFAERFYRCKIAWTSLGIHEVYNLARPRISKRLAGTGHPPKVGELF